MDIEILCNTADEELFANIATNARAHGRWAKSLPAHDGHAIIVGGGPSVRDQLGKIKARFRHGQRLFALNGAAGFLNQYGLVPDYQVMVDARPENVDLIGDAEQYLIASQCHPLVFHGLPRVTLWHPAVEGIDAHLPEHSDEFALVGGGTTVGLSAMCLAYTLGYRHLHLYGFDSSHRLKAGHAYAQAMNAHDHLVKVTVGDRTYTASLAMARQAELFPQVANNLIGLGCEITVEGDGLIQEVIKQMAANADLPLAEDEKYRRIWAFPAYREFSPGEREAAKFINIAEIGYDNLVLDFGCGSGKGGARIKALTDCLVHMIDFASNCVDEGNDLPFSVADLSQPMGFVGDVGYCTDVLEHIPPEQVDDVIVNIMACVERAYFKIALFDDNMGGLIGHPLHLSVFPPEWWDVKFSQYEILYRHHDARADFPYLTLYVSKR